MYVYKKMYLRLFNRVTDALRLLDQNRAPEAAALLIAAQQETEDLFLTHAEEED